MRTAEGCAKTEAAAIILTRSQQPDLVTLLAACILDDPRAGQARIDWLEAAKLGASQPDPTRHLINLASDLAVMGEPTELATILDSLSPEGRQLALDAVAHLNLA